MVLQRRRDDARHQVGQDFAYRDEARDALRLAKLDSTHPLPCSHARHGHLLHETRERRRGLLQGRRPHPMVGSRHQHLCHDALCHYLHGDSCQSLRHGLDLLPDALDDSRRGLPRDMVLPTLLPPTQSGICLRDTRGAIQPGHPHDGLHALLHLHGGAYGTRDVLAFAGTYSSNRHQHLPLHHPDGTRHHRLLHDGRRGSSHLGRRRARLHPCWWRYLCRPLSVGQHRRRLLGSMATGRR